VVAHDERDGVQFRLEAVQYRLLNVERPVAEATGDAVLDFDV